MRIAPTGRAIAAAALLVACNAGSSKPGGEPADPWSTPSPKAETEASRASRMASALAHVGELAPKVAALRQLSLDRDVPRAYETKDAMRGYVRREIAKDLPRSADTSDALSQLGLLPAGVDLATAAERALVTHGGAYYDASAREFFFVIAPDVGLLLDGLVVHELVHALQDQHFGLDALLPHGTIDADHLAAREFLVEGDATFTMFLFAATQSHGTIPPELLHMLRGQLAQLARLSPAEMVKQNALGIGAGADPDLATSLGRLDEVPLTLVVPMFDAYLLGADLVAATYERGGWAAVDALYASLPDSTEQVLHPATKLFPHREPPVAVELAAPAGETVVADLVLGELQWQIYFEQWVPAKKLVASEGWGGDRALVTRRRDGTRVARIHTVWDTRRDADEFRETYLASLATRFPTGAGSAESPAGFTRGDGRGTIRLVQHDTHVDIVDGVP